METDQHVVLLGLIVGEPAMDAPSPAALEVVDCAGAVRLQNMILGDVPGLPAHRGIGVLVSGSSNVAFAGCEVSAEINGATGMQCVNSNVSLHGSTVVGGKGSVGGIGLSAESSLVFLEGSVIGGGRGSDDFDYSGYCDLHPGDGGAGLVAQLGAVLYQQASLIHGGAGGTGYGDHFCSAEGLPGIQHDVDAGSQLIQVAGPSRTWTCSDWSYRGGVARFDYNGEPGDVVSVLRSDTPAFLVNTSQEGIELLTNASGETPLGVANAQGWFQVDVPMESLIPRGGVTGFFLQARVVDMQGATRLAGPGHIAILSQEVVPTCDLPIFVDQSAALGGDGTSWGQALPDLGDALISAQHRFDECGIAPSIWIAEGTYRPPPDASNERAAFEITTPVRLYGGFEGSESHPDERDISAHPTILTGDRLNDDGPGFVGYADNSRWVVRVDPDVLATQQVIRLDGLNITGARSDGGAFLSFWGNGSRLVIESCSFYANRGDDAAGGLHAAAHYISVRWSRFAQNRAGSGPGGANVICKSAWVVGCSFTANESAGYRGSALGTHAQHHLSVENSYFAWNNSGSNGACRVSQALTATVSNCTFFQNTTSANAAGLTFDQVFASKVGNSVLWANQSGTELAEEAQISWPSLFTIEMTRSCVEGYIGLTPGEGNFSTNPWLMPNGQLGPGSPCIDAGTNRIVPSDQFDIDGDGNYLEFTPLDLAGNARLVDDPTTPDTGSGPGPVIDLGAFEVQVP